MNDRGINEFMRNLMQGRNFLNKAWVWIQNAFAMLPWILQMVLVLVALIAVFNIVFSLWKAIFVHRNSWCIKENAKLMYSYLTKSGHYQRTAIFRYAIGHLMDQTRSPLSFCNLAYSLGKRSYRAQIQNFIVSFPYLFLYTLGMIERGIYYVVGISFYTLLNIAFFLLLVITGLVNLLCMPIFYSLDKLYWKVQHCPRDYFTFSLANFACPSCGVQHGNLYPGTTGIFWARCSCGVFLPCSFLSKRFSLAAHCPKCEEKLASFNLQSLTLEIMGGDSSGKTAYIAAFQNLYRHALNNRMLRLYPQKGFEELEEMVQTGILQKSPIDTMQIFEIVHESSRPFEKGISLYEVPDEMVLRGQYDINPLHFAYCDGVILMIDPLNISQVEELIVRFINTYSELSGRKASRLSNLPIAVLVTKADLTEVNNQVGANRILSHFEENRGKCRDLEEARNQRCREYLFDIGLSNAVHNLESVFSWVAYFAVSAMGDASRNTAAFRPIGVMEPVMWVAAKAKSEMLHHIEKVMEAKI